MEIDLSPIINVGIDVISFVLMALGTWAVARLGKKLGLDADDQVRVYLDEALNRGIGWAREKAKAKAKDMATVEVRSEIVAEAVKYALERVPDAVKHFNLDEQHVRKLVEARLGGK